MEPVNSNSPFDLSGTYDIFSTDYSALVYLLMESNILISFSFKA